MDDKRKETIVKEILYWKKSRMLPEQYCDYLLALYTEGNQLEEESKEHTKKRMNVRSFLPLAIILVFLISLYITEMSFRLQMALSVILMILSILITVYFAKKRMTLQIPLIGLALILLFTSVEFMSHTFPEQIGMLFTVLVMNCSLWLLAGWRLKLVYFSISGFLGIGVLIVSLLFRIF